MNRITRALGTAAGVALLIATGIGASSAVGQGGMPPPCAPGQQPSQQAPCMPSGTGGNGGNAGSMPACAPGQQPSPQAPCVPPGAGGNGGNGGQGGKPGAGQGLPADLPPCGTNGTGSVPTPQAPCIMDKSMPDCAPGQQPPPLNPDGTPQGPPCKPQGAVQLGQAPPQGTTDKLMTMDVDIEGTGANPDSLDVTLNKIVKGIPRAKAASLTEQLQDDSLTINTTSATRCWADKKADQNAEPDRVPCAQLSDAADNWPGSHQATIQARMKFDSTTFMPTFTATKILVKGKSLL